MKNILLYLSLVVTMAACQQKGDVSSIPAQSQMPLTPGYNNSALSDTAKAEVFYQPVKPEATPGSVRVRTVYIKVPQKETAMHPVLTQANTPPVVTTPAPVSSGTNTSPSSTETGNNSNTGTASTIPQPVKKTGWSKAAKGAVIGAGAGAIGGAILSKKKGVGAIIGGVIGAAGGYVIGKGMDKKDNRFITN